MEIEIEVISVECIEVYEMLNEVMYWFVGVVYDVGGIVGDEYCVWIVGVDDVVDVDFVECCVDIGYCIGWKLEVDIVVFCVFGLKIWIICDLFCCEVFCWYIVWIIWIDEVLVREIDGLWVFDEGWCVEVVIVWCICC